MKEKFNYLCELATMFLGPKRIHNTEFVEECYLKEVIITNVFPTLENGVQYFSVLFDKTIFNSEDKLLGKVLQNNKVVADIISVCKNNFIHIIKENEAQKIDFHSPVTLVAYGKSDFCMSFNKQSHWLLNLENIHQLNTQIQENIDNLWANPYVNSDFYYRQTPEYVELANKLNNDSNNSQNLVRFLVKKNHDLLDDVQMKHFNDFYSKKEFSETKTNDSELASQFLKSILSYSKFTHILENDNNKNPSFPEVIVDMSVSDLIDFDYLALVGIILNENATFIFGKKLNTNEFKIEIYTKDIEQIQQDLYVIFKNDIFKTIEFSYNTSLNHISCTLKIEKSLSIEFNLEIIGKIESIFKNYFDKKRKRKYEKNNRPRFRK